MVSKKRNAKGVNIMSEDFGMCMRCAIESATCNGLCFGCNLDDADGDELGLLAQDEHEEYFE